MGAVLPGWNNYELGYRSTYCCFETLNEVSKFGLKNF